MTKKLLIIFIVIPLLLTLGIGWLLTYDELQTSKYAVEAQTAKASRYEELSKNYERDLQEKSIQVEDLKTELGNQTEDFQELQIELQEQQEAFQKEKTIWEAEKETYQEEITYLQILPTKLEGQITSLQEKITYLQGEIVSLQALQEEYKEKEKELEEELILFRDTYGKVYSGIQPPYGVYTQYFIGRQILLINNSKSTNPTWVELKNFLREDETDQRPYILGEYVCGNFAEALHNNAEVIGIKAAIVCIEFEGSPGHALNVFKTTDRGLVFIDCTGPEPSQSGPSNWDKIVETKIGKKCTVKSIFPEGWRWRDMDVVVNIEVFW